MIHAAFQTLIAIIIFTMYIGVGACFALLLVENCVPITPSEKKWFVPYTRIDIAMFIWFWPLYAILIVLIYLAHYVTLPVQWLMKYLLDNIERRK